MNHHALIRNLIAELRQAREQLEEANNAYYWHEEQANSRAHRAEQAAREAQAQAENERWNREQLDDAYRKAERQRSWGDEYGAQHTIQNARRWYS